MAIRQQESEEHCTLVDEQGQGLESKFHVYNFEVPAKIAILEVFLVINLVLKELINILLKLFSLMWSFC